MQFWKWYKNQFYQKWYNFIQNFNIALSRINSEESWKELAETMTKNYNPYFLLLDKVIEEINALEKDIGNQKAPYWVKELKKIYKVKEKSTELTQKKQGSILASLKSKAQNLTKDVTQEVDEKLAQEELQLIERAKAFLDYLQSLNISISVATEQEAFEEYKKTFLADALDKSELVTAYKKYYRFKLSMNPYPDTSYVYDLVFGPLDFLLDFSSRKASCYLENKWEQDVLSVVKASDEDSLTQNLFKKDEGALWKFYNTYLTPFIIGGENGYRLKPNFRKMYLPFNKEILSLLQKSNRLSLNQKDNYSIELTTIPIEVNTKANVVPYYVSLKVNCSDTNFTLNNYNYPQTLKFNWSPQKCGDTTLSIIFSDLSLHKNYPGSLGFARFLQDFKNGSKTFYPQDFPSNQEYLKKANIKWIKIGYKLKNQEDILNLLNSTPKTIPQTIIECPFEE